MKELRITGGVALVDDEDFEYLSQFKWRVDVYGYAVRHPTLTEIVTGVRMQREILCKDVTAKHYVDHIDHNLLNNCKSNLRICTPTQNAHNVKAHRDGESRYKGVSRQRWQWRARINAYGKHHYLGSYTTEEDAAVAYNIAALELHGKFAVLNVI